MKALKYENLIRRAFGFKKGGRMIERWEDPASLANTDAFRGKNLAAVKVGTGYAMTTLVKEIINHRAGTLPDGERDRLDAFTERVVVAGSLDAVSDLVEEFHNSVEDQYFKWDDGIMSLK